MTTLAMQISGMTCGHCVKAVRDALTAVPGVEVREVSIGSATVAFDDAQVDAARVTQAVLDEGYRVVGALGDA